MKTERKNNEEEKKYAINILSANGDNEKKEKDFKVSLKLFYLLGI